MTASELARYNPRTVPFAQRLQVHALVSAARLLATCSPQRIRAVLGWVRCGAHPADRVEVQRARDEVVAVSLVCAGPEGCLSRSLAVALLCRVRGAWPTWCLGVRRLGPFGAHAWVEAAGEMVGEQVPPGYYVPLTTVPPLPRVQG